MTNEWQEVVDAKTGHIFEDGYENGVRYLIMRGPFHLCAYVGVPLSHPLANQSYDDIPLDCHGGLTFSSKGEGNWPKDMYWYGWDYGHCDDASIYITPLLSDRGGKQWTVKMVKDELWHVTYQFSKLIKLAESIVSKKYTIVATE